MSHLRREPTDELINVHRVRGDKEAIIFLKNAEHDLVEGLFYNAKRDGQSEFYFRDLRHVLTRNKDGSFTVGLAPNQEITIEQSA
jgi:hypothetical protein